MNAAWWRVARQPRWLAGLAAILVLAGGFAFLAQWQIGRAVAEATIETVDSETPVDVTTLLEPMTPQTLTDGGRRVTVTGTWTQQSTIVFERTQGDTTGEWLVRNFMVNGSCLPIAVGFGTAIDPTEFIVIDDSPSTLAGRLVPSDDIIAGNVQSDRRIIVAAADLINEWQCESMYDGYVILLIVSRCCWKDEVIYPAVAFEARLMNPEILVGRLPLVETCNHKRFVFDGDDGADAVRRHQLTSARLSQYLGHCYLTRYRLDVRSTSRRLHSVGVTSGRFSVSSAASMSKPCSGCSRFV